MFSKRLYTDKSVRAGFSALSACSAQRRNYLGYAIHDLDRIMFADSGTVTETDTAVFAHSVAAVESLDSLARLYSREYE